MLYVSDVVAANLAVLEAASGEAYDIGTGVAVTVNELFGRLRDLTGYRAEPCHGPARKGDVCRIILGCS